jgi:hypothetical protein
MLSFNLLTTPQSKKSRIRLVNECGISNRSTMVSL